MQVHLLYFGILRELFNRQEDRIDLPSQTTVAALLARLKPEGTLLFDSLAVAVNRIYARPETILAEGDEVALLPPVSGGSDAR